MVANSDNTTSNVELIEVEVDAGGYRLVEEVKTANANTGTDFVIAWPMKEVLDPPNSFVIVDDTPDGTTIVKWHAGASDHDDHKFRLQVSDENFATLDEDVRVKGSSYTIASPGLDGRSIRVSTYPDDEEVAYTPNADFNRPDSFDYTMSDGTGTDTSLAAANSGEAVTRRSRRPTAGIIEVRAGLRNAVRL